MFSFVQTLFRIIASAVEIVLRQQSLPCSRSIRRPLIRDPISKRQNRRGGNKSFPMHTNSPSGKFDKYSVTWFLIAVAITVCSSTFSSHLTYFPRYFMARSRINVHVRMCANGTIA